MTYSFRMNPQSNFATTLYIKKNVQSFLIFENQYKS